MIKRSYLILLSVLAGVLFYSLVMLPAADRHGEVIDEYGMKLSTLAKYKAFLDSAPAVEEDIEGAEKELEKFKPLLIGAQNDTIGFSKLNSYVQSLLSRSGVEVVSLKPLNVKKHKYYAGLPLQVNVTATVRQLRDLLQLFSSGMYLVSIDALEVTVINTSMPDKVRVKIELSGYRSS